MSKIFILVFISFFFSSCSVDSKTKKRRWSKDGYLLEGIISKDSLMNGEIKYYNSKNQIVAIKSFINNIENGYAVNYYTNGKLRDSSNYLNGKKNGSTYHYNSFGKLMYQDYYYYGRPIGQISLYDSLSSKISDFFFVNFEGETKLHINYSQWAGVKDILFDAISLSSNLIGIEDSVKVSLFLYLINPPQFRFDYSLCKQDNDSKQIQEILPLTNNEIFKQLELPLLNKKNKYLVRLEIYDSILLKKSIIYKEVVIKD